MEQPAPYSSTVRVPSATTSVVLQPGNGKRSSCTVYNNAATANLYVNLGPTASIDLFTIKVIPQGYYETPGKYTGPLSGIWDAIDNAAMVTEVSI
jgi:hypothetical protein